MVDYPCNKPHVVIIGAGFTGLSAAYELSRRGGGVTVLEKEDGIGGLGSVFETKGQPLEVFYHHWFKNDQYVLDLVNDLGCRDRMMYVPSRTGTYYQGGFYKLCTPLDVLRFKPLGMADRIRLGLMVLKARRIKDWKRLESLTAEQWLKRICGSKVYEVMWEPLLRGKFGRYGPEISAVWFWNKLVLRGGSRDRTGKELLAYYRGGFSALLGTMVDEITSAGGVIRTSEAVEGLVVLDGCVKGVRTANGVVEADAVIATPALPIIAGLVEGNVESSYLDRLGSIEYLASLCLVLELSHSLSDIYWLNVLDSDFPFVGVIEHTNFIGSENYGGRHIVYLTKYLPESAELYQMSKEEVFEFSLPYIKRMFGKFEESWVQSYHVFKARYSQPIVRCHHSEKIPSNQTPLKGFHIASMAQIYPEDRGTNYAIQEGRRIGVKGADSLVPEQSSGLHSSSERI